MKIETRTGDRIEIAPPDKKLGIQSLRLNWTHTTMEGGVHVDRDRQKYIQLSESERRQLARALGGCKCEEQKELVDHLLELREMEDHPPVYNASFRALKEDHQRLLNMTGKTIDTDNTLVQGDSGEGWMLPTALHDLIKDRAADQPGEGSFSAAWEAMMAGEVRERPAHGDPELWIKCRIIDGMYQEQAEGRYWPEGDESALTSADINGKWRIPPTAEPERYEFAEALRLYQEQGAKGIRWCQWIPGLYIYPVPYGNYFELSDKDSRADPSYNANPEHFAGADWEIVPKDGEG